MTNFTVRVELHDADSSDYAYLHDALAKQGFSTEITGEKTYQLPPGEYNYTGTSTRQDVLDAAKLAAALTGKKYAVLVTESAGRMWYGLEKA